MRSARTVILAVNAGSSSIKVGLYEIGGGDLALLFRGLLEGLGDQPHFTARDAQDRVLEDRRWDGQQSHEDLLGRLLDWIDAHLGADTLVGVGHRVVHGGHDFVEPVRLDDQTIARIEALTPLAPLHQPHSVAPMRALRRLRPELAQAACFDTAFHHTIDPPQSRYALPRHFDDEGVRRYGFHGLSYEFIAGRLREIAPEEARGRVVVAHLGNGSSLCGMREGVSRDTTMGFTALDGLVMGTRAGSIDPGILLYLLQQRGMSAAEVETLLYRQSGLLGVSGLSADMRTLLASDDPHAAEAVDLFCARLAQQAAAMAATLEGLDTLVFTGGIGEHAAAVRAQAGRRLAWLGVDLDPEANQRGAERISTAASRVAVRVIATNEELVVARHARACLERI